MNRDTTLLFAALGPKNAELFELHRKELRGAYIRALSETVTLSGYDRVDDRFLDLIDTQLTTLVVRSGAVSEDEVTAVNLDGINTDKNFLKKLGAENAELYDKNERLTRELAEARKVTTVLTSDQLRAEADAMDKVAAIKRANEARDSGKGFPARPQEPVPTPAAPLVPAAAVKADVDRKNIPAVNPGRMPKPISDDPLEGLPKPQYEAPAHG